MMAIPPDGTGIAVNGVGAVGSWHKTFIYLNNRLRRNALETIAAMLAESGVA